MGMSLEGASPSSFLISTQWVVRASWDLLILGNRRIARVFLSLWTVLKFCNLTHSKAIHHFIPTAHSLPVRDVPRRWQVTQQSQLPVFIQLLLWQCLTCIHAVTCPDSDGWGQHLGFTCSGAGWPAGSGCPPGCLRAPGHICVYLWHRMYFSTLFCDV